MTVQTIEAEAVEQTAASKPDKKVFHLAATDADAISRELGGPWTTLCGIYKPTCRVIRLGSELSSIEKCVICSELWGGW